MLTQKLSTLAVPEVRPQSKIPQTSRSITQFRLVPDDSAGSENALGRCIDARSAVAKKLGVSLSSRVAIGRKDVFKRLKNLRICGVPRSVT